MISYTVKVNSQQTRTHWILFVVTGSCPEIILWYYPRNNSRCWKTYSRNSQDHVKIRERKKSRKQKQLVQDCKKNPTTGLEMLEITILRFPPVCGFLHKPLGLFFFLILGAHKSLHTPSCHCAAQNSHFFITSKVFWVTPALNSNIQYSLAQMLWYVWPSQDVNGFNIKVLYML